MEFKIKHKLTFDSPDTMSADLLRSNRKTKTMLRSFRGVNKDLGSYDIPSSNGD